MQTFLPYSVFRDSVECLDPSRLGNQVYRECLTLIRGGWSNHPASKMWRGHEYALCEYALEGLVALMDRNLYYPHHFRTFLDYQKVYRYTGYPWWLGWEEFHSAHRAILLAKDYEWYSRFGWSETPAERDENGRFPYIWPEMEVVA